MYKLWPNNILPFKTVTTVVMYHMLNSGHHATIRSEIRPIIIEAQDKADEEGWVYKDTGRDITEMGIHLSYITSSIFISPLLFIRLVLCLYDNCTYIG